MERRKLTQEELTERLSAITGWKFEDAKLVKRFEFANFDEALAFVNRVGAIAEKADHHPDITFGWGYAEVATTTHDRQGVTDHDMALAGKINTIGIEQN